MTQLVINRVEEEKPEIGDFLNTRYCEYTVVIERNENQICVRRKIA